MKQDEEEFKEAVENGEESVEKEEEKSASNKDESIGCQLEEEDDISDILETHLNKMVETSKFYEEIKKRIEHVKRMSGVD